MARKKTPRKEKGTTVSYNKSSSFSQIGRGRREEKTVIIIVCEGETEQSYFNELASLESRIIIKPELANKSNWVNIISNANKAHIDENTKVYYVLDIDCIIKQKQMVNYIQEREKIIKKDVIPLESYICFETWLLYHYETNPKSYDKCEKHETDLKKHIPNYIKASGSIYSSTKSKLLQACDNAKKSCRNRDKQIKSGVSQEFNCTLCFSEVWKLFRDIGLYTPAI